MGANRDRFMAYVKGWSDGAGVHAIRQEVESHATLRDDYMRGYSNGRKARSAAHLEAGEHYGEKIHVVRVPEPIFAHDVASVAFDVAARGDR